MRHRNRNRNGRKHSFPNWAIVGACLALTSTIHLSSQAVPDNNDNLSDLDPQTQQAMIDAINDEYHARAFYNAVIDKFGQIRPFSNIVQAEARHAERLSQLFDQYGLPIPEDTFAGNIEAPATIEIACQMGVEAEIDNVQMYDNFLDFVQETDLRAMFTRLRYVSETRHKVAFERCNSRHSQ
jgi:rubrerythrin